MSRTSILATALLVAALFGCQAVSPELAKDADDVEVSIEEADRAFLYSQVDAARLLQMARPAEEAVPPAHLYVYNSETRELREIARDEVPGLSYGDNGLLAVSVETHGASINLWNWNEGDVDRLELRLDGFSARLVEGDAGAYDVIFAAKEPAVFPLCKDKDYEIFKARIVAAQDGTAELLEFAQLTHNDVDDTQPAFSPDGHWIVFVSEPHGPRNVALMDAEGHYLRVLAPSAETSSYFPVVLPNNEECLYVSESNGITEFLICGLDGRGHRRASGQELKQMLFSWDDFTRHRYLMTDIFAREQSLRMLLDLPHTLDLLDLVLLAEWNSPMLKQYRQLVLAARAERVHNQKERSPKITIGGFQIVDTGVLVDESTTDPGDIPAQGFTRLLFTLSLPLFQGSLNKAIKQRDMWQEVVYSQTYLNNYNDLVQKVAVAYTDYSEQMARAAVLRRILDLNRKRRFLWEVRVGAGKELPGRLTEAESYISEAEAALTEAEGKAEAARARLLAALGVADMPPFEVEAATLDWEALPMEPPPLEEIQALAQINHPELARLKFLELRAAAIRDMGAPSARGQTSLDLTYGHGSEHFFSPTTDDYIGATLSHTLPLQKLGVDKAYREQWTHEMMAYREEREQARLDINAALQETEAALRRVTEQFEANQDWRRVTAEKLRLSRIYGAERVLAARGDRPYDVVDQIEAEIDHLNQQLVLTGVRAEFCRHLAQYYTRAFPRTRSSARAGPCGSGAPWKSSWTPTSATRCCGSAPIRASAASTASSRASRTTITCTSTTGSSATSWTCAPNRALRSTPWWAIRSGWTRHRGRRSALWSAASWGSTPASRKARRGSPA